MTLRERIEATLREAVPALRGLEDGVYLFGSAAAVMRGVPVGRAGDIDLLASPRDARRLRQLWTGRDLHIGARPSQLFRSDLARYRFPLMDVEVCGGLEVRTPAGWTVFEILDYEEWTVDGCPLCLPTLEEQRRICLLFHRPKDLERMALIDTLLAGH